MLASFVELWFWFS